MAHPSPWCKLLGEGEMGILSAEGSRVDHASAIDRKTAYPAHFGHVHGNAIELNVVYALQADILATVLDLLSSDLFSLGMVLEREGRELGDRSYAGEFFNLECKRVFAHALPVPFDEATLKMEVPRAIPSRPLFPDDAFHATRYFCKGTGHEYDCVGLEHGPKQVESDLTPLQKGTKPVVSRSPFFFHEADQEAKLLLWDFIVWRRRHVVHELLELGEEGV
jgi:hypothetical protein